MGLPLPKPLRLFDYPAVENVSHYPDVFVYCGSGIATDWLGADGDALTSRYAGTDIAV